MLENIDETNRYGSLLQLTPTQAIAIDVLDCGGTQSEAAERAGVSRVTVSRWIHNHPAFIAELNRRHVERADRVSVRIDELTLRAMELVALAIEQGDTSTAIQWLRISGPMNPNLRGRGSERPLSADAIITRASESAAMSAPMEILSDPYRMGTMRKLVALVEP